MFKLFWHWLTALNKCLNKEANGIPGHGNRFFDSFTLRYTTRERGNCDGIASLLDIRFKDDCIFVFIHIFATLLYL